MGDYGNTEAGGSTTFPAPGSTISRGPAFPYPPYASELVPAAATEPSDFLSFVEITNLLTVVELEDYGDNVSYSATVDSDDPDQWYSSLVVFRQRQSLASGCLMVTDGNPVALPESPNAIRAFLLMGS